MNSSYARHYKDLKEDNYERPYYVSRAFFSTSTSSLDLNIMELVFLASWTCVRPSMKGSISREQRKLSDRIISNNRNERHASYPERSPLTTRRGKIPLLRKTGKQSLTTAAFRDCNNVSAEKQKEHQNRSLYEG
jgi:hypothetical protein